MIRNWLIKKLVGVKPIMLNMDIKIDNQQLGILNKNIDADLFSRNTIKTN